MANESLPMADMNITCKLLRPGNSPDLCLRM